MKYDLVIGVFDGLKQAERAIKDLEHQGFGRDNIYLVGKEAKGPYAATFAPRSTSGAGAGTALDVASELEARNVPREDAQEYAEAVRHGDLLLMTTAEERQRSELAADIMSRHEARGPLMERRTGAERAGTEQIFEERTGATREPQRGRAEQAREGETVIPVVQEELKVGKRFVERGRARIYTHVTERPVEQDVQLREEKVTVERRPVDRPATDIPQESSIEVREMAEEPVVAKEARVVEEVVVDKKETEHTEKIKDTVKRSDVEIQSDEEKRRKK